VTEPATKPAPKRKCIPQMFEQRPSTTPASSNTDASDDGSGLDQKHEAAASATAPSLVSEGAAATCQSVVSKPNEEKN